ncbi:MAG TPA: hypothetical protein VI814_07325 [Candidatus Limnocylindria bacterium]
MAKAEARSAFQYGLAIFTLTALLGLANATQVFGALDRNTLLTHLHSGTLGWITMGVIGLSIWIFGGAGKTTAVRVSAASTAAYVLAFWSGNFQLRAIFGVTELAVIVYWWWFAASRGMAEGGFAKLDIPKLSVVLGLTTLVIGSTLGVIVQVILGTGNQLPQTTDLVGAHASAQTGGYLVLVAAGFIEWQLTGGGRRSIAGFVQIALLFVGGLVLAFSLLLSAQLGSASQGLAGLATLLTIGGIVVVAVRLGRTALAVSWSGGGKRHIAMGVPWVAAAVIFQFFLVQQFIASQGDINKVSIGLLHSLDHSYFVGLMTNILFGAVLVLTAEDERPWPWADNVVFWGLNLGAAAFVFVLITVGSGEGAKPFTHPVSFTAPIMGLSALLGIATLLTRLQGAKAPETAPARA